MNQVVYVVIDMENEILLGAYNAYEAAMNALEEYNSDAVSVTPVLVDAAPDTYRQVCYSEEEVEEATNDEIELAKEAYLDEVDDDDDDWDEPDWDDDDDEDEDDYDKDDDEDDSPSVHDLAQDLMGVLQRYL